MSRFYNSTFRLKLLLIAISSIILINRVDAQIKIGTNGAIIAPSSLLELESSNQGLLLPRLADTVAINALNPPNGMLIYLTKAPAVGLYVRKVTGWEFLTGSLGGNGNFNSLTVSGSVTAGSFSGPLTGNATSATTAVTATNATNSAITNDLATSTVTYPTFVTITPGNSPLRTSNANLSYIPSTGILTAKGFNGPLVGNVTGISTLAIDATNAANTGITNDVTTNAAHYPTFVSGTNGNLPQKTSSPNLTFNPSTGILTATGFAGAGTGLTGTAASLNAGTASALFTPRTINNVSFDGTSNITVAAAAGTLSGNTMAANVVTSSLTTVGTIANGIWNAGSVSTTQLRGRLGSPSILNGPGAGAGPQVLITGTDLAGVITVVVANIAPTGAIATVTYNSTYPTSSYPVLYPANASAALISQTNQIFATGNTTSFTVSSGTSTLAPGTYSWNYHVIGN